MELNQPIFKPYTTDEIKPEGWLLRQLSIQAKGLSGHLDQFWPDIKDSQWVGGQAEGWERVPYWLDGFIPLAWLLDDENLKKRAKRTINEILSSQAEDGWICPDDDKDRSRYDVWAMLLMLKVLIVYYDSTHDPRIQPAVEKALRALDRHIDQAPLFNWGQARWFEGLIAIWWLYEQSQAQWLLDLASKLQGQGFDWFSFFKRWPYRKPDGKGRWSYMSHVVNNAMMLKAGPLFWRLSGENEHLKAADNAVKLLDAYHGMVTGVFTGDECLAGTSPVQGTELCAVAEYLYSLEHLVSITGEAKWADRLEQIAYNALPATFSPDMWTHQYDQQVNQVSCSRQDEPLFNTNGGDANLFGLEPNFGCCTANLSQAWPKLALSTFMQASDGVAAVVYAPCALTTTIQGSEVSIKMETDYPFRDTVHFIVDSEEKTIFTLWLRIPQWTSAARIEINGSVIPVEPAEQAAFYPLRQFWEGETCFTLKLPMTPSLVSRPNSLVAISRGPLVYSLPILEKWVQINQKMPGHEYPHCDYEVLPTGPWNYGLCLDKAELEQSIRVEEKPLGEALFSPDGAPVVINVKGRKVDWEMKQGAATPVPGMKWVAEEVEDLQLIPYGCTNLRMTEMPLVKANELGE